MRVPLHFGNKQSSGLTFQEDIGDKQLVQCVMLNTWYRRRSNYVSFLILRQNSKSQTDKLNVITAAWQLARSAHNAVERQEAASRHCL